MGCSAVPSRRPGSNRGSLPANGSRPRRSGNRSGRSGTGRRATPRASRDRRRCPRSAPSGTGRRLPTSLGGSRAHQLPPAEQLPHLGHQILRLRAPDGLAGHQDGILSCPELGRDVAPSRPQDPSSPVPRDRASDPSGGDDGELSRAGGDKQYHPLSVDRTARVERPSDLVRAHRTVRRRGGRGPCGGGVPGPRGRLGSASGSGTRASSRDDACSAGTCAYPWPSSRVLPNAKAGSAGPTAEYTSRHVRRTKGLTTERASRPRRRAPVWKRPVLLCAPLHPPANPAHVGAAPWIPSPEGFPPLWKGAVDRHGDCVL